MPTAVLPPSQIARISVGDLRAQIVKKLGIDRAQQYFTHLNQFLSQKLGKSEFTKLLLSVLGKDNISLHNQLIKSILKNAYSAKIPSPFAYDKRLVSKPEKNTFPSPPQLVWTNGDILPLSPRRTRSGVRRVKDRAGSFGPNGRVEGPTYQSPMPADELSLCDLKRPVQHFQDGSVEQPVKKQRFDKSEALDQNQISSYSRSSSEFIAIERQEDFDYMKHFELARGPLLSPIGISLYPRSIHSKTLTCSSNGSDSSISNSDGSYLCNSEQLHKRMEKTAAEQGLEGVTTDSTKLVNSAVDVYLKRLISSCTALVGSRTENSPMKNLIHKHQDIGKVINGVWQAHHTTALSSWRTLGDTQEQKNSIPISLHDFKVAMELNPQQLGENWPSLLEKLFVYSFEE